MHKLRKLIALLGVVAISSTLVVSTASAAGEWYEPFINNLDGVGVDWTDSVGDNTTRCEWATAVVAWNGLTSSMPSAPTFTDVPEDHPCYDAVETAAANMVISGYSGDKAGYFGPGDLVTREQGMKMVVVGSDLPQIDVTSYDFFPDYADISDWATEAGYPETAYYWTVFTGDSDTGMLRPADHINHAEAAKVITTEPVLNEDYLLIEDDVVTATGDLDVEISDDTPEGATLPSGATSVPMATWDFTAGNEDAVITTIKVHRFGVSELPSGHQVYLYDGSERLTSGKNVNSSTNLAIFNNLNLEVPKGDTITLTLRMDVGTVTSSGEIGFEIEEVLAGAGEATLHDTKGDMFGLSTTAAGKVTIQRNGSVTDATVGEKGFTFAKFKIDAATEDAMIEEIGLYVGGGSINVSDLENFKLFVSGETLAIAEVEMSNSKDVATFVLDTPYELSKGDTRSFWATAELNTGRTGDTLLVYIDEGTDVVAIGGTYGYGMSVIKDAYDGTVCSVATPIECNAMTLEGGDITLAGNTITNRNIAVNDEDVAILSFTLTALTDVTFDNFGIHLMATEDAADPDAGLLGPLAAANFTDIKISEVDGDHVWGPIDSSGMFTDLAHTTGIAEGTDLIGYYLFTDDLYMEAGEVKEFEITVDVENNAVLGEETITAAIDIEAAYPRMKDVNNKVLTNAESLVPTSDYIGDAFTMKSNNLTIVKSSAVGSTNQVRGTDDAELVAFSVGAGDANDTKVTQIKLTGYVDEDVAADGYTAGVDNGVAFSEIVQGMNLYAGSVAEENMINDAAKSADPITGELVFDNLLWEIPAGDSEVLIVTGDLSNNAAYNGDEVKVDVADVSLDLVAEDDKGNSITSVSPDGPNGGLTDDPVLYTQITVFGGGTLTVDTPNTTPLSEIVVASSTGNEFSEFKFSAAEESFVINKLAIKTSGNTNADLSGVSIRYFTDAEQTVEETKNCAASATTVGDYVCTGMNMFVPNPDLAGVPDYANLTVEADLKPSSQIATLGDQVSLSFSLGDDFLAMGEDSGRQVKANGDGGDGLIVADSVLVSYGSGAPVYLTDGAVASALDTAFAVDAGGIVPATPMNPGSLICVDNVTINGACDPEVVGVSPAEEIMYFASSEACTGVDTPVVGCTAVPAEIVWNVQRGVNGTTATVIADNVELLYIDVATVNATNVMQVQAADLELATTEVSRDGALIAQDPIMTINVEKMGDGEAYISEIAVDLSISEDWAGGETMDALLIQDGGVGTVASISSTFAAGGTDILLFDAASMGGYFGHITLSDVSTTLTVKLDAADALSSVTGDSTTLSASVDLGNISNTGDVLWTDDITLVATPNLDFLGVNPSDSIFTTSKYE